jgi:hypothetical protein
VAVKRAVGFFCRVWVLSVECVGVLDGMSRRGGVELDGLGLGIGSMRH